MEVVDLREYLSNQQNAESDKEMMTAYHSDGGTDLCNWDDVDCCVGGYSH